MTVILEHDIPGIVRRARRNADVNQRELAASLGVCQSTVARWETGERQPCAGMLIALLRLAGLALMILPARSTPPTRPCLEAGELGLAREPEEPGDGEGRHDPKNLGDSQSRGAGLLDPLLREPGVTEPDYPAEPGELTDLDDAEKAENAEPDDPEPDDPEPDDAEPDDAEEPHEAVRMPPERELDALWHGYCPWFLADPEEARRIPVGGTDEDIADLRGDAPMRDDSVRDRGGRRYPAHLDPEAVDRGYPERWDRRTCPCCVGAGLAATCGVA